MHLILTITKIPLQCILCVCDEWKKLLLDKSDVICGQIYGLRQLIIDWKCMHECYSKIVLWTVKQTVVVHRLFECSVWQPRTKSQTQIAQSVFFFKHGLGMSTSQNVLLFCTCFISSIVHIYFVKNCVVLVCVNCIDVVACMGACRCCWTKCMWACFGVRHVCVSVSRCTYVGSCECVCVYTHALFMSVSVLYHVYVWPCVGAYFLVFFFQSLF
jgi:hypothetical protein